ncbi:uncharacterized protein LOC119387206 [Rhipicephalus sanguineus]|uniref:uncharacterized protein LOC119387206 n=1 Tax=Rhipicephalus sanguineus TaxID=34632 RepID=UPI0020C35E77|nr:uncharacterized protein LOC119387206 [Rhipicephalus sanguineus]
MLFHFLEKLFLCNSSDHRQKQMKEGTLLQPFASPLKKPEQQSAPPPERTQNEVCATARCKDAAVKDGKCINCDITKLMKTSSQCFNCSLNFCILLLPDAENMASVADQDSNGAGTLSLGAAVASTPTRVLFEEIDGQVFISKDIWLTVTDFNFLMAARNDSIFVRDAATKIFSTAGLMGHSVTGRPSNRTKGDPKPPLDSGKLSALKDFFHHFVSASPKGQSAEQIKERSKKFGRHLAGKLADVQSVAN